MSNSSVVYSCALPPPLAAWRSIVSRSIAVWDDLATGGRTIRKDIPASMLRECRSLDEFLALAGSPLMIWFFQRRNAFMSQKRMKKWSSGDLEDYVLLPASQGFVTRGDCFFVSHFWDTPDHPDPNGEYLRLHQAELEPQTWSYIWVDWSCMPQSPRSGPQGKYFHRCLQTMSGIIRNCGFMYFYPPFKPRLWILYEIIEFLLTSSGGIETTPDIASFLQHINEMLNTSVQATLVKHGYRCSYDRDRHYLIPRLELLVLLHRLTLNIYTIRHIMDLLTWINTVKILRLPREGVELNRFEGTLVVNGEMHTFTPLPQWEDGEYS